ncbi:hypothetical protein NQ314_012561 [Rhamnusium bicolor]|uniref:Uncharacterized protein n=1 Tax=Rhamnusium bicolor TaxID=1586634 RepID=A0AAV8XD50_9CUCU|nr:hypothetical protein NQ314_012561 [Rhamnusium bicolor]
MVFSLKKLKKSDPDIAHEALTLTEQLKDFSFIVSLVVWYDILYQINVVSKSLQSENADIIEGKEFLDKCCKFLEDYRKNGFMSALITAKELAGELGVEPIFKATRIRRTRRQPAELAPDEPAESAIKKFEIEFFNVLLDKAIIKLKERFSQFNEFSETWSFFVRFKEIT